MNINTPLRSFIKLRLLDRLASKTQVDYQELTYLLECFGQDYVEDMKLKCKGDAFGFVRIEPVIGPDGTIDHEALKQKESKVLRDLKWQLKQMQADCVARPVDLSSYREGRCARAIAVIALVLSIAAAVMSLYVLLHK